MKIIAHIQPDTVVLVEMTVRELANIAGEDYESELAPSEKYGLRLNGLEVGSVYEVSPVWRRLRKQEHIKDQLEGAAKSLESLASLIRYEAPRCTPPEEPKAEEGGAK